MKTSIIMAQNIKHHTWQHFIVGAIFTITFFIIWLRWDILIYSFIQPNTTGDTWSILDNKYNILITLFTGLSFCAFIITLLMQRAELRLQREELINNTQALYDQKNELEISNKFYTLQNQRDIFFKLLESFRISIKQTEFMSDYSGRKTTGYIAFDEAQNSFEGIHNIYTDREFRNLNTTYIVFFNTLKFATLNNIDDKSQTINYLDIIKAYVSPSFLLAISFISTINNHKNEIQLLISNKFYDLNKFNINDMKQFIEFATVSYMSYIYETKGTNNDKDTYYGKKSIIFEFLFQFNKASNNSVLNHISKLNFDEGDIKILSNLFESHNIEEVVRKILNSVKE